MRSTIALSALVLSGAIVAGCGLSEPTSPTVLSKPTFAVAAADEATDADEARFNLEVKLTGEGSGSVKFRQRKDEPFRVDLDTKLKQLAPNTAYRLQRAVDTVIDGECTSSAWLTLGKGSVAQSITTDDRGSYPRCAGVVLCADLRGYPVASGPSNWYHAS